MPFFSPGRAKKRHSFHCCETGAERRCQPPKPARGAETSTAFFAARSCTSGVDRRSRTEPRVRRETNVEGVDQPKAAPHCLSGSALRAGTGTFEKVTEDASKIGGRSQEGTLLLHEAVRMILEHERRSCVAALLIGIRPGGRPTFRQNLPLHRARSVRWTRCYGLHT